MEFIGTEELAPKELLLRKIDSAVDLTHIYDFAENLYRPDNGRPGVDHNAIQEVFTPKIPNLKKQ